MIISALNSNYLRIGFDTIVNLLPVCEKVKKLSAICKICLNVANFTFRTCSGSSEVLIGGADMYMPLCRECHLEKTKQQNLKAQNEILHSETVSTNHLTECMEDNVSE